MLRANRRPLPPLGNRSTRVRLLAWSYLDAAESPCGDMGEMVDSGDVPSSRPPRRNEELWYAGSYRELESAVDALPRPQRRAFHAEHLDCRDPFKSTEAAALLEVVARMPHSFYVPTEISEAAGYLPSEAKVYSR